MKVHLCDFCKAVIDDQEDLLISAIVTDVTKVMVGGEARQDQLDMCVDCARAKGIIKTAPTEALVPSIGALTPEEIAKLENGTL